MLKPHLVNPIEQQADSSTHLNIEVAIAPVLANHLLISSLQLYLWLIFRPSAWKSLVKKINPTLSSDFCLLQLKPEDWRNPLLRRVLISGYLVWPIFFGLPLILGAWLMGLQNVVIGVLIGVITSSVANLFIGTYLNLGGGFITFIVGYICFSWIASLAASIQLLGETNQTIDLFITAGWGISFSLFGGVSCGFISHLSTKKSTSSRVEQALSVVAGILMGTVFYRIAIDLIDLDHSGIVYNLAIGGVPSYLQNSSAQLLTSTVFFLVAVVSGTIAGLIRTHRWKQSLLTSIIFGVISGASLHFGYTTFQSLELYHLSLSSVAGGFWLAAVFTLTYALAAYISGPQAAAFAGACGLGGAHTVFLFNITDHFHWLVIPFSFIFIFLGLAFVRWLPDITSPFLEIYNLALYGIDERRDAQQQSLLHFHSAFWNELRRKPSTTLKDHLLLVVQRNPAEAQAAVDFLVMTSHRRVAQEVQVELDAQRLEACSDIECISQSHYVLVDSKLNGPIGSILHEFYRVSRAVEAALNQSTKFHQRLALDGIGEELDGLKLEFTRSDEPYAPRFIPIIISWQQAVVNFIRHLSQMVELKQEIENPYIPNLPLTEQQKIFTGRVDVALKIEQLLLDSRRPPLLLYGQRRMGKTSVLQNLGRMLRSKLNIVPVFIDGLEMKVANTYSDVLLLIANEIQKVSEELLKFKLSDLDSPEFQKSPFSKFTRWLDTAEKQFNRQGNIVALLMLDEFEAIEKGVEKGRFDADDIFSLLRHIIQHRTHFKLLMAGSHTLEEFERWASYLINVQTIKISYLAEHEARQLIEYPIEDFALHYTVEATQRIIELTRCHPALLQLICYETVELKNSQPTPLRRLVQPQDVELAAQKALDSGNLYFADIRNQASETSEISVEVLTYMAQQGQNAVISQTSLDEYIAHPTKLKQALKQAVQRDLLETVDGNYRFQVELIRRWFAQKE